ncbi:MAG: histidine phosphatase family protein [Pseudomonadota bacterium]
MISAPKIWLLRHGETLWNAERRVQGQLESELTPRGIAQAHQQAALMAPVLANSPPCFVSPLGRAQQTAEIALGGKAFVTDARLAEAHAGQWQGRLREKLLAERPDLAEASALEVFLSAPEGERFDGFQGRVSDFLGDLTEPSVVVAHGLLGQVMRGLLCGLGRAEMGHLANAQGCVYVLENGAETVLTASA